MAKHTLTVPRPTAPGSNPTAHGPQLTPGNQPTTRGTQPSSESQPTAHSPHQGTGPRPSTPGSHPTAHSPHQGTSLRPTAHHTREHPYGPRPALAPGSLRPTVYRTRVWSTAHASEPAYGRRPTVHTSLRPAAHGSPHHGISIRPVARNPHQGAYGRRPTVQTREPAFGWRSTTPGSQPAGKGQQDAPGIQPTASDPQAIRRPVADQHELAFHGPPTVTSTMRGRYLSPSVRLRLHHRAERPCLSLSVRPRLLLQARQQSLPLGETFSAMDQVTAR